MSTPSAKQTPSATAEAAAGSSSILDNPELAESTLIALLCNKTDPLLNYGGETPKHLVTYARRWLKLVGDEFRDEVIEGLQRKQRGLECTINYLGPVDGAPNKHWLNVKIKEPPKQEDEEANPDPTAMHLLWLSPDVNNIIWYISMCEQQRGAPDRYRSPLTLTLTLTLALTLTLTLNLTLSLTGTAPSRSMPRS